MATGSREGYVECSECGHAIEAHDVNGCHSIGGECTCTVSWTKIEIRAARRADGLPERYNSWDYS
jgi:hypothetical protein